MDKKTFYSVGVRIFIAFFLFWSLDRHSYGYFTFLRWATCGVGVYFAFIAYEQGKNAWVWILGIIALIFNPLIPFHLGRDAWAPIDLVSGILMLVSIYFVREGVNPEEVPKETPKNTHEMAPTIVEKIRTSHAHLLEDDLNKVIRERGNMSEREALKQAYTEALQLKAKAFKEGNAKGVEQQRARMKVIVDFTNRRKDLSK